MSRAARASARRDHATVADGERGLLVGPALDGVAGSAAHRQQQRVDRGGERDGGEVPVVAVAQVRALVGEQRAALGRAQGGEQRLRDDDAAGAAR